METFLTPSNVTFILGILAVIFSIYNYFRNPQIKADKEQVRIEEDIKDKASILSQKEVENKAGVLEKQFEWYMKSNTERFTHMEKRLDDSFLLAANHTNTVDTKVTELVKNINQMSNEITRLATIIGERIPKK